MVHRMFAEVRTKGFQAIFRKHVASTASYIAVVANRVDSPTQAHWIRIHVGGVD